MQLLIGICMAAVAMALPVGAFFSITLAFFWLMAFFSATHDIAADGYYMLALSAHDQAAFVGVRSTFFRIASVIGQGGLVIIAGWLEESYEDVPLAWSSVFFLLSAFFLCISVYHMKVMPSPSSDKSSSGKTIGGIFNDFVMTFVSFFKRNHIWSALAFMLLYRLPEAFCIKLVQPFLISPRECGGLGLTTSEVGLVNGTVGVIALLLGGIAGGIAISRGGLKQWLWPMALSLTLPCGFYCVLAMLQPESVTWISFAVFIEQFGYGFGFSAYMLYLIYFCRGDNQTSHYAFCTAFMAFGMMIPGMFAGWIYDILNQYNIFGASGPQGYINFFWFVMAACISTLGVCTKIEIDPSFGKKTVECV